ncbi:tetratricopeptide repeat protein [Thiotrichales bacterium 19S11-10]|nr:tetratricopeptide repeat protein [Thiotrichales bacterium 19S11-10]
MKDKMQSHINDALKHYLNGDYDLAERLCNELLKQNGDDFYAIYLLGGIAQKQHQYQKAIDYFYNAIKLNPNHHETYHNLGLALHKKNKLDEAIINYKKAIQLNSNAYEIYYSLGLALQDRNEINQAIINYTKSLQLNPNYYQAYDSLGFALLEKNQIDKAIIQFKKSIQLNSNYPQAYNNLGVALQNLNKLDDAEINYKKAIQLNPNYYEAYSNLGVVLQKQNKFDDAIINYRKAIQINPSFHEGYSNLGIIQLLLLDFKNGWQNYQHRLLLKNSNFFYNPSLTKPTYTNQDLNNKTLYLYHEQGLGDTIMMSRFLNHFINMKAHVVFYVPKNLKKLLQVNFPTADIITEPYQKDYDYHLPVMSIPMVLHINHKNMPLTAGYLSVNKSSIEINHANSFRTDKKKIGIVWKGNSKHKNDKNRSFDLKTFLTRIDHQDNQQYYSLQVDLSDKEKQLLNENNMIDLGSNFTDFYDTATAISYLDALISIDTSVAHLSAALSIPTYIILPATDVDWRWGYQGETSYWYDSITLIRDGDVFKL